MAEIFAADLPGRGTRRVAMTAYATACVSIVAIIFLTNWPTYQFEVRGGPIPAYFYLLPMLLIVPVLFAEPAAAVRFLRDPMFWWFFLFVATGLIWLVPAHDFMEEASQQWRLRMAAFLMFFAVSLLASDANRKFVAWVIVACVALASAANWFDMLRPYRIVPEGIPGASGERGAGMFINPNIAASMIAFGTVAALPLIPQKLRGLLIAGSVFGIAATFSRGGFVMIAVALLGAIAFRLVGKVQSWLLIVALPLVVGGVSVSYDYLMEASENRRVDQVIQRLAWFQDPAEHDEAVEGRRHGAATAWRLFVDSPVIGHGTGITLVASRTDGPHNMYLLFMAEQGLMGLLLWLGLIGICVVRGWRCMRSALTESDRQIGGAYILLGAMLSIYGLFSHNVLEEAQTIFIIAFLAAATLHVRNSAVRHTVAIRGRRMPRARSAA